jgi:hypothetical protein
VSDIRLSVTSCRAGKSGATPAMANGVPDDVGHRADHSSASSASNSPARAYASAAQIGAAAPRGKHPPSSTRRLASESAKAQAAQQRGLDPGWQVAGHLSAQRDEPARPDPSVVAASRG